MIQALIFIKDLCFWPQTDIFGGEDGFCLDDERVLSLGGSGGTDPGKGMLISDFRLKWAGGRTVINPPMPLPDYGQWRKSRPSVEQKNCLGMRTGCSDLMKKACRTVPREIVASSSDQS